MFRFRNSRRLCSYASRRLYIFVFLILVMNYLRTSHFSQSKRYFYKVFRRPVLTQGGEDYVDKDMDVATKRDFIKNMTRDAWREYKLYAWGSNQLRPMSREGYTGGKVFGDTNFGLSIIDSLGTLHIMELHEEFKAARDWVKHHFNFRSICNPVSLFEINIRVVGGFLSAYALTSDTLFLDKAIEVARLLLPAFNTPLGIPRTSISPCSGRVHGDVISLAELGTLHLEFVYLSRLSKDPIFEEKVQTIRHRMYKSLPRSSDLYRELIDVKSGGYVSDRTTLGGNSDSFYEYLLKSWIQTGDEFAWKMYENAMNAIINNKGMMHVTKKSHLLYFGRVDEEFSSLACFSGGMFALGSSSRSNTHTYKYKQRDLDIGANITNTCHESYSRSKTGLGPEEFSMKSNYEALGTIFRFYILRPEVIESYFILYRITNDPKYRDWGWAAALAIQKWCKVGPGGGYTGKPDVYEGYWGGIDDQPTYFLAETLKYLYLLFSSPDLIDLNQWVFNTEAHPLPIKGKNPMF